jgi:lipopolysaccharide transport system ATP-binding protein
VAKISIKNVNIDFPILDFKSRSFRHTVLFSATGGKIGIGSGNIVYIRALEDISCEIEDGDRVGLVGNNGAGKSTFLKMLAGIYAPSSGSLLVKGKISSMLSISLGMDMEASGFENIFIRGAVIGIRPEKMKSLVEEISSFSELGDYLNFPIRTYSTGMLMRLAFSISTCVSSEIILMDEWLSVGDSDFVEKAKGRLKSMVDNSNILVLASHNLGLVKQQCNKIYKLDKGAISKFEG